MSDHRVIAERNGGTPASEELGRYDALIDKLCNDEQTKHFLGSGNVAIEEDFVCHQSISSRTDSGSQPSFHMAGDPTTEFRTILFGEMGDKASGTRLGAMGSYIFKPEKNFMDDYSSVRHIYQLSCPQNIPDVVRIAWDNQVKEIERITSVLAQRVNATNIRGILTPVGAEDVSIRVASQPVYVRVAVDSQEVLPPVQDKKIKLTANFKPQSTSVTTGKRVSSLDRGDVVIGSDKTYPCHYFSGYQAPYFQHKFSEILQHDIYDITGGLVAPWDVHTVLAPRTLVLMEGYFDVWKPQKISQERPKAHVFQFIAEHIKVIGTTTCVCETPDLPTGHSAVASGSKFKSPTKRSRPLESFGDMGQQIATDIDESPSKRLRHHIVDKKGKKKDSSK